MLPRNLVFLDDVHNRLFINLQIVDLVIFFVGLLNALFYRKFQLRQLFLLFRPDLIPFRRRLEILLVLLLNPDVLRLLRLLFIL